MSITVQFIGRGPNNGPTCNVRGALLAKFINRQELRMWRDDSGSWWQEALGGSLERAIDQLYRAGLIRLCRSEEVLDTCMTVAELKRFGSRIDVRMRGKKAEMIAMLVERGGAAVEEFVAAHRVVTATESGIERVKEYFEYERDRYVGAIVGIGCAIDARDFARCAEVVNSYQQTQLWPKGVLGATSTQIEALMCSSGLSADRLATVLIGDSFPGKWHLEKLVQRARSNASN